MKRQTTDGGRYLQNIQQRTVSRIYKKTYVNNKKQLKNGQRMRTDTLSKKEIQIANKHININSTSVVIREMQMKTII